MATLSAICVRSGWGRRTGSCKPPTPPPVRRSQPSPAAGAGPAQRALLPLITGSTGKRLASHCAPDEVDAGEMAGHLPPEPGLRRGRGGDRADRSRRRARRGGVLGGDEVGFAGQRRVPGMPGDDPHLPVREGPCRRPRPTSWRLAPSRSGCSAGGDRAAGHPGRRGLWRTATRPANLSGDVGGLPTG